jgi:hypothetical protein
MEQDEKQRTQSDRRKPGRQKKNHGGDTAKPGEAYKEYQQMKLKEIDAVKHTLNAKVIALHVKYSSVLTMHTDTRR